MEMGPGDTLWSLSRQSHSVVMWRMWEKPFPLPAGWTCGAGDAVWGMQSRGKRFGGCGVGRSEQAEAVRGMRCRGDAVRGMRCSAGRGAVPGGTSRRKPQPVLCLRQPGFPALLFNFYIAAKLVLLIFLSFFFFLNIYVEHHIIAEKIIVTYPRAWCTLMLKVQLLLATKVITFPCQIALN